MLYPIELRVRKDRQANAKVREVKQTGSRKTMLRDWYLCASTVLLQQKRAQSLTRSRSQLQWLDGASLSQMLRAPIHTATTPASHWLGGPAPGRCCHPDADETPRTSALLARPSLTTNGPARALKLTRIGSRRTATDEPAPHLSLSPITNHLGCGSAAQCPFLVSRSTECEKCTRSVDFLQFQNFRASNRSLAICTKACNLQNDYR